MRRGDLVVEIGPGRGRLTAELARTGARVHAVELDERLAAALRGRWANVEVTCADALHVPWPNEPFAIVANVPVHVTTELLRRVLEPSVRLVRADLIVEWGYAVKRATIWPTSVLSVYWNAWYEFALVRRLDASCFTPRPAVDAAVLRVIRREEPLVAPAAAGDYERFLRRGFARGIRAIVPPKRLRSLADTLGFDAAAAPRELDAFQWAALFRGSSVGSNAQRAKVKS